MSLKLLLFNISMVIIKKSIPPIYATGVAYCTFVVKEQCIFFNHAILQSSAPAHPDSRHDSFPLKINIQGLALHPLPVTEWLARPCSRTISLVALRSVEFPPHVILHCSQDLSFDLLLVILFSYSFVCFFACCSVCKLDLYSPRLYRSLQILLSVGFNISRGSKNGNPTYIKDQQYTVVVSV